VAATVAGSGGPDAVGAAGEVVTASRLSKVEVRGSGSTASTNVPADLSTPSASSAWWPADGEDVGAPGPEGPVAAAPGVLPALDPEVVPAGRDVTPEPPGLCDVPAPAPAAGATRRMPGRVGPPSEASPKAAPAVTTAAVVIEATARPRRRRAAAAIARRRARRRA